VPLAALAGGNRICQPRLAKILDRPQKSRGGAAGIRCLSLCIFDVIDRILYQSADQA
jgi:hypothetical protein